MNFADKLIGILREEHGEDLNLKDEVYYLFFKDGLFELYYDEDEKTIKVNVEFLPEDGTHVYFRDDSIGDHMGIMEEDE